MSAPVHDAHLLRDIGAGVLGAALVGLPAYLLRLPLLLAYIAAGVLLGPHLGLGIVQDPASIGVISEIGLVLLLFILGLEIDLRKLVQAGRAVLINGVTQFLGCFALGWLFFGLLGWRNGEGRFDLVYLAVACSLSSTLVVVKILSDRFELDTLTSRITLGILVLQDLWAITFLAVQPDLADLRMTALALSLGRAALLVLASWLAARFLLPFLFARAGKQPELMLIMALGWCFAMCGLADALHLSREMGALVAGVAIASFPYQTDMAAKVSSLRDFFITLFFVALGLQIPRPTGEVLGLAGAITGFVVLSRFLTVFPVMYLLRYGNRASLVPALNLSQLSEFALVLAALGVSYGHVSPELLPAFVLALVATALTSSVLIPAGHTLYRWANGPLEALGLRDRVDDGTHGGGAGHGGPPPQIVLLGFFREASSLLHAMATRDLAATRRKLMVVDFNPEAHHKLHEMGIRCAYGDISHVDTLKHLHLDQARVLVCTIPDHLFKGTSNHKLLMQLRALAPKSRIVVTAETLVSAREMYCDGADYVFLPRIIASRSLADVLERLRTARGHAIRARGVAELTRRREILA